MNSVEIVGRIVRDPVLTFTAGGTPICNVSVAVGQARYDFESNQDVVETAYISTVFFGNVAEKLAEQVAKGDEVWVRGELSQTVIEKDGKQDRKTKVRGIVFALTRRSTGAAAARKEDAADPDFDPERNAF